MADELVLEKLENLKDQYDNIDKKVDKIETAVGLIAVQSEQISSMQLQIQSLWLKYDHAFSPEGIISELKQFQSKCPKEALQEALANLRKTIDRQWMVIGLLATIVAGSLLKAFGVLGVS
ncbi:MAG: hypothetical protein GY845_03085 [Planctomycetes bacterium]|nr:hypothetical protein [Planctomycetota bacterium]